MNHLVILDANIDKLGKPYKHPTLWLHKENEYIKLATFTNNESKELFYEFIKNFSYKGGSDDESLS